MQGVLGAKLRKAREELGLSQAAFARALGFSSQFISLLEADKRAPSLSTLNKIASFLKKDIGYFLQEKEAAFALINSADTPVRQAFTAAHEYCHYLKDRHEGPLIDNPDVFVDEYVSLYHPREKFAQTFAASFLMPASKVRAIIEKEFGGRKLNLEQVLYMKRYFGVSFAAMLPKMRELGFLSAAQFEEFIKRDPESREAEVFGGRRQGKARSARPILSDRFRLLQFEAAKKQRQTFMRGNKE